MTVLVARSRLAHSGHLALVKAQTCHGHITAVLGYCKLQACPYRNKPTGVQGGEADPFVTPSSSWGQAMLTAQVVEPSTVATAMPWNSTLCSAQESAPDLG